MNKRTNMLKRNSGFIVGCVIAAGVSFAAANAMMANGLPTLTQDTDAPQETQAQTLAQEKEESRVYETDPFTVTASGNIIKGIETEQTEESEKQTETDEDGNVIYSDTQLDENGNPVESYEDGNVSGGYEDEGYYSEDTYGDDGSYNDGGYSDGSYDGGYSDGYSGDSGSYYDQPIEIYDSGNSDYYYDDSSANTGSSQGTSGSTGSTDPKIVTTDFWSDSILPQTYSEYIDESILHIFNAKELRLIRNEIFARHGRIFDSQELMDYFTQKSWYVPTYSPEEFDAHWDRYLTEYEVANLNVILDYEASLAGN